MSWSQPPYRSRSRSPPYRGGQYPPPDAGGPQAPPPPRDWDDRDRGWDRRDSYRGRSRSPGGGDYYGDRKRRRSPSPYDRGDRYEPRPRYADDYDTHTRSRAYSPNRERRYGMGNGRRREFADPYAMDSPASFKQFAEWFRHTYPTQTTEDDIADKIAADANEQKPKMMRVRYEKYKKEFHCRQVQTLFDYHRKSPWFQERYDPSPQFENLRKRVRQQGWGGRLEQFLVDIEEGKYDPNDDEPVLPDAANGGDAGDPPSSPVKEDPEVKQEEADQQFDEDAGGDDNEGGRRDRGGLRVQRSDEISIQPEGNEVMIRTIPPDIGRLKLEDVLKPISGFMYLALGEPMQKRNYYRAGWIRFTDDADMEKTLAELADKKIDGFKLHVSQSTRPFLTRIKNTPEIASRPDRIARDLANVKVLAAKLEDEYFELRKFKENPLPASNGNSNGAAEGGDEPVKSEDVPMGDVEPEPLERGSEAVERRIAKLVAELPEEAAASEDFETKKAAIALDMYVAYVRAAFNTCYYCIAITDHVEELHRKCAGHRRKPLSKPAAAAPPPAEGAAAAEEGDKDKEKVKEEPEKDREREREDDRDRDRDRDRDARSGRDRERDRDGRNWQEKSDEQWVERLDMRIASLINRDKVDPKEYGGKDADEELTKAVEPFIKQEDEGKFRCKTCSKLFKATSFVEKHIANKHSELVKQLDDLKVFNNFALDPQRIQPYTRVPAPIGNGQPLASQAFGLQGPVPAAPDFNNRGHPYQQQHPNSYPPPGYGDGPPPYRARSPPRRGGDRYFPSGPGFDSLPPKPSLGAEPMRGGGGGGRGGFRGGERGPPPPPPPDAKEDPRAAAGRKISYHDMDEVAEGDVELMY